MAEKYNPKIMDELIDKVGIRVKQMAKEELIYYKDLLVRQGIYAWYVIERKLTPKRGK